MNDNPYAGCRNRWLKTQLHLHTTRSDGCEDVPTTLAHYRELGFAVVAITDHRIQGEPDRVEDGMVLLQGQEHDDQGKHHVGEIGSLRIANHPNWCIGHWLVADLLREPRFHAMEIYNGVVETHPGDALCTHQWDQLLATGRRIHGIAADDAHGREHRGQAWVMVDAEREPQAVLAALHAGRFYASTGVALSALELADGVLTVAADEACEIRFMVERGTLRQRSVGTSASYRLRPGDGYVRIELRGALGRCAWTNPVWCDDDASCKRLAENGIWLCRHLGIQQP